MAEIRREISITTAYTKKIGLFFYVNVVNKSICIAPVGALMG